MSRHYSMPGTPRAAVYLRISEDKMGDGLANERQRSDCLRILRERGWELQLEYEDTESASDKRRTRPGYDAMLRDYKAGRFDALVCWDLDRLTRQPRQLEDWIDLAEDQGLKIVTANGEADLTTDGGRMYARIKAAVAKAEVERKSTRQRAQARQSAEKGNPRWRNRPFGYEADGRLRPVEADAIRQAYSDVLRGTTPTEIGRRWDAAELPTTGGARHWTGARVSDILKNRRNVAQSTYKGEVVGPARWPAVIDIVTWEAVHAILTSPNRAGNRTPRKGRQGAEPTTLLTGIVTCATCGDGVVQQLGQRRKDGSRAKLYGCHTEHATASQAWLDSAVFVVFTMALPRIREAWPATDESEQGQTLRALRAELATVEGKLAEMADAYAADLVTLDQLKSATSSLRARQEDARAKMADLSTTPTLDALLVPGGGVDLIDAWFKFDLGQRRAALASVFSEIRLHPRGKAGKGTVPTVSFATTRPLEGFPLRIVGLKNATPQELELAQVAG